MNSANNQENQEGTSVSLQLSATDREGTPTYSASGLPPGLSIGSTGLISGSIGIGSFGSSPYQVTVTATDGSYTSSVSFVWTVTPRVALVNPGDQGNARRRYGFAATVRHIAWRRHELQRQWITQRPGHQ